MTNLPELQAPIDADIVRAMIESTPENWQEIVLTLHRAPHDSAVGAFTHELVSPEGLPPVTPVEKLFEHTCRLDELLRAHSGSLSRAKYAASLVKGQWSYKVEFEYASAAL